MTPAYVHPIVGGLVIAALLYAGALGLRARSDRRRAAALLARHARVAPLVYWCLVASWVGGWLSTWLWRPELDTGGSTHFTLGVLMALAATGGAVTARWMSRPDVRGLHPWFGAAAMLLAAAQVFFGLQITP